MSEFCTTIASVIQDEADRSSFLADAMELGAHLPDAPELIQEHGRGDLAALGEADLALAEQRLTQYIGPLAGLLVKRAAKEADSVDDLYVRLADHLTNEVDRKRFLAAAMVES